MAMINHSIQLNISLMVQIRPCIANDLEKLEWNGQFSHFRNLFLRSYREHESGRRHILIADCQDYPIGRLFIQLDSRNRRIANGYDRGYLYSFHVMEILRGFGIGTALMQAAENHLIVEGFGFATVAVAKQNERALNLYQRLNYRIFGEDPGRWRYLDHEGHVREVDEPCWLLEKQLQTV